MSVLVHRVLRGVYRDSVALMRISRQLDAMPGVLEAALLIGTPANLALLRESDLLSSDMDVAGVNDLVVAVRAADETAGTAALEVAMGLLATPEPIVGGQLPRARTVVGGVARLPGANLAVVSVPGAFAGVPARQALERGLHVLLFSDNVPLEDERALKTLARDRGLLCMGPDCGTALIAGTPIAFANAVPRGDIGIVSASGTGLQEVSSLIARAGGGVSHGIGVGGRDLDEAIGGITTLMALDALERDAGTRTLVLLSKPPAQSVAARVLEHVARVPKPVVVCFLGSSPPALPANARAARTLRAAAELALGRPVCDARAPSPPDRRPRGRWVRGLYCGGTLAAEAQLILLERGLAVQSNAPVPGVCRPSPASAGHLVLDLGADEYTRGRPHPMIEPARRDAELRRALTDPEVAVVVVDVVLGRGSHEDPAGVLAAGLRHSSTRGPLVIASVTGTEQDPQCYSRQVTALREAGVIVAPSSTDAAELAAGLVVDSPGSPATAPSRRGRRRGSR